MDLWISSHILIASLVVWGLTRYIVQYESGDWFHSRVDTWLYSRSQGEGFLEFVRYGWTCTICFGQWVSFGLVWAMSSVPPWEWGVPGFAVAVAINAPNAIFHTLEGMANKVVAVLERAWPGEEVE